MKPSVKSSLPAALIAFSAAAMVYIAFGLHTAVEDHGLGLEELLGGHFPREFWGVWANVSSDGALTYVAQSRGPGPLQNTPCQIWQLDETFRNPKQISAFPPREKGARLAYLDPPTSKRLEFYGEWIRQIAYAGEGTEQFKGGSPIVWWNGPKGRFDVYSRETRLRIGSIGGEGVFVKAPAVPSARLEPFAIMEAAEGCFFATTRGAYRLELPYGPQHLIFDGAVQAFAPMPERHQGAINSRAPRAEEFTLLVVSGGTLLEMDAQGRIAQRIPLPPEASAGGAQFTFFENGRLLIYDDSGVHRLWLLAPDGQVLRHLEYDYKEILAQLNKGVPYTPSLRAPTILPPIPVWMTPAALAQSTILSAIIAGIVLWHQGRIGSLSAKRLAWTVFAFIFGLLGAAAYVIAHWDKRTEACPECGKRRPIAQDTCPHCNIPWPKPAKSGFEVLETH